MSIIKEFREFYLRNVQVNSGAKLDQETGFPVSYLINGVSKFNRFLKGHFPSKDVMEKFLESITFKLNKEDRAQSSQQGLIVIATDSNAEDRISNATDGTVFTAGIVPHQLPELVLTIDGSDTVIGTPVEKGGLKLSILRRTLSGLFRKNYKIEINPDKSVIINGSTFKVELDGDEMSPGNNYTYATDGSGVKGWIDLSSFITALIGSSTTRRNKFVKQFAGTLGDITILYTDISAAGAFNVDRLASGTTDKPKTDYTCEVWFKSAIAAYWVKSDIEVRIADSTGDITFVSTGDGTYRVVLIG